ncbi:TPA: SIR2 family protein [Yersinia enterocolitica]
MSNDNLLKKLKHKKRTVKDLADYIRARSGVIPNYSLFLGAGSSVTSGIRTAVDLVDEWRKEVFERISKIKYSTPEDAKKWLEENEVDWYEPSNEYSSLFEKKFDLPSQRRRFVEEQVDKKLPSIGYAYLVELFENRCFDTVFTTNFDDLINEAFYQFSGERPLLCAHDSSIKGISITSSRPKIIKLHGDYLFDGIKSSLNETESLEINTKEKIIEFTKEYGLIFVGYAGNDKSIMEVLNFLLKQDDYLKNGIYWCVRTGDYISPELFKILSKDRVYLVEIDGFDELMAALFYEISINDGLSLGAIQKSTKRDRMITNFLNDEYGLAKNEFIGSDLKRLRQHSLTQDISSLINELSDLDSNDGRIPEVDFKNLLHIDNLVKNNKLSQAEDDIVRLLENADDNIKPKYFQRLINVYKKSDRLEKAIEQSDRLVKLDEFNISYSLLKASLFKDKGDKVNFFKSLLPKYEHNYVLKNQLSLVSLEYLDGLNSIELVNYSDIGGWLNDSLSHNHSLDNSAWRIKNSLIKHMYSNSIDRVEYNQKMNALIEEMRLINPTHTKLINIESDFICDESNFDNIVSMISKLNGLFDTSSIKKKEFIVRILCDLHRALIDSDKKDESRIIFNDFFNRYLKDGENNAISPILICKAQYLISYERNLVSALNYAKKAMYAQWSHEEAENIFNILILDEDANSLVNELLDNLPASYSLKKKYKLNSEFCIKKKDYLEALNYLDKSYDEGLSHGSYIASKTFINLCAGDYRTVINDVDNNISFVRSLENKDILIVNREFAKVKLSEKIKETDLRSVIAHNHSKNSTSMCAYFILNDEFNATKILKKKIESDYFNIFTFASWPIVPEGAIQLYKDELKVA